MYRRIWTIPRCLHQNNVEMANKISSHEHKCHHGPAYQFVVDWNLSHFATIDFIPNPLPDVDAAANRSFLFDIATFNRSVKLRWVKIFVKHFSFKSVILVGSISSMCNFCRFAGDSSCSFSRWRVEIVFSNGLVIIYTEQKKEIDRMNWNERQLLWD